jgi:hypothetical protein
VRNMGLGDIIKRKSKKGEPTDLEKKIMLCRGYAKLWSDFFQYFSDSLEGVTITEQQEAAFFKYMTVLATRHFEFVTKMDKDLKVGEQILVLLRDIVSLHNLQEMSEAEFSSTQIRWHEIYIHMNKTLGRLIQKMPITAAKNAAKPAA